MKKKSWSAKNILKDYSKVAMINKINKHAFTSLINYIYPVSICCSYRKGNNPEENVHSKLLLLLLLKTVGNARLGESD